MASSPAAHFERTKESQAQALRLLGHPSRPSGFKRSSEREDPDGARLEEARRAEAEKQLRLQRFEEIGMSAASASVLVTPLELEARRYSCGTEDLSTFDKDGSVR